MLQESSRHHTWIQDQFQFHRAIPEARLLAFGYCDQFTWTHNGQRGNQQPKNGNGILRNRLQLAQQVTVRFSVPVPKDRAIYSAFTKL
jgi:hypothetical protein